MKIVVATAVAFILVQSSLRCSESRQFVGNGGSWKLLKRSLGISAMHMQLLPNNKMVAYDRTDAGPSKISLPNGICRNYTTGNDCTSHAVEFNLADRSVRPLTVASDTFCSSGVLSPNGTLIQTGGFTTGDRAVRYLSPCESCDWVEDLNGLAVRRWYATNQILPDGRAIVVGGRGQFNYEFVPKHSAWEQDHVYNLPFLIETSDQWENNLYPFVHLSTDGNLFVFANTKAILLDYAKNIVVRAFPNIPGGVARNYPSTGSSVILPILLKSNDTVPKAEVMVCGGTEPNAYPKAKFNATFVPASNTCGRLVITDSLPQWEMEAMPMARIMGDMVMLPTGDVLIINGAASGSAGWTLAREPVLSPVLYKSGITGNVSRVFDVMTPTSIPRMYHSTAHLMPDGQVLVAGSNANVKYEFRGVLFPTELRVEAFYPPYFNSSTRPRIIKIEPAVFGYGARFSIAFAIKEWSSSDLLKEGVVVTMVFPSFATHSFSMNQRMLVLPIEGLSHFRANHYTVNVVAPASAVLAPPGYYLVFVVHRGVPSGGKWVHIAQ